MVTIMMSVRVLVRICVLIMVMVSAYKGYGEILRKLWGKRNSSFADKLPKIQDPPTQDFPRHPISVNIPMKTRVAYQ